MNPPSDAARMSRRSATIFGGILIVGAVLRGYWAIRHGEVFDGNACAYARIALNLVTHLKYAGLYEGPELVYPPLFPILLALGSLFTGSVAGAARLVPFLSGVLLVPLVFALARLVSGVRVALITATLVALHPVLIDLSGTPVSDGPYLFLMVVGLYLGLRSLESGRRAHTVWCGVVFGLAYLTRPEALLSALAILGAGLATDMRKPAFVRHFGRRALYLAVPIVALMTPYAAYVSANVGTFRLEGKETINYAFGRRLNLGMAPFQATHEIRPDLGEEGPLISPNHFVAKNRQLPSVRELVDHWIISAQRNKAPLVHELLVLPTFGSFLGIGLVALGLFRRPWTRRRAQYESVLITVGLGHLVLILGLHLVSFRYLLPLIPLSLIWVSQGIDGAALWAMGVARRVGSVPRLRVRWVGTGARCALVLAILLLAVVGTRRGALQDEGPESLLVRDVGTWLGNYRPGPKRIMTLDALIPYYSGGTYLPLPYAGASLALEYVHRKRPDFIVLIGNGRPLAPYLQQWEDHGIPDRAARLIYRTGRDAAADVLIYEWADPAPVLGRVGEVGPR